ncbi:DNA adenine methylase [Streptococcus oralis]|uniref:Site-specific DNA-methyltransferase (adenine-specific) n=1 Tax=Streptococcus oralis TaxID=1303 RepID=A0A139Q4E0_STROR|nr:Dam family site-specific DNA-(adenine-N6)-methyltransferase [Streptococcus oralis]KXT97413.1 DNA adenine methylase [Streptococcus oralis]
MEKVRLKPILKWAGGKRQLLDVIREHLPTDITVYVEPFLGGGAVLFDLQPQRAIINDYNSELMNVYKVVKEDPQALIDSLYNHKINNSQDYFYNIRELDRLESFSNLTAVERASRIIYLNKTCYNGLFRVNQLGQFNTPYGRHKNPQIINEEMISDISYYFNTANLKMMTGDYKLALKYLRKGSFVYFDPPYLPLNSSSFTGYTELGFPIEKQRELRDICIKLHKRGIRFLVSNSFTDEILDLYSDDSIFKIKKLMSLEKLIEMDLVEFQRAN